MKTDTFKLTTLSAKGQIAKFGEVLITPDTELELVKVRSAYALVEKAEFCSNEATSWIHVDREDELNTELFLHPFANKVLYTDVHPYEVIKHNTPRKMTIREMDAELDPEWKMNMIPGGFVGHVTNNRAQSYTYTSNPENPEKEIRYHNSKKRRGWFDKHGNRYSPNTSPYKFYDYNF